MNHASEYLHIDALRELQQKHGPQALHEQHCEDGVILIIDEYGDERAAFCPACEERKQRSRIRAEIEACGIGSRYFDIEWDDLEHVPPPMPAIRDATARIAEITEAGHCALLSGPAGTGKTQCAVLIAKAAIRAGCSAVFANIGHEAIDIRSGYGGDGTSERRAIERLSKPDLLVLDDIGAGEADSGRVERRLLYLVTEARQNHRRSTVVTTNLEPNELAQQVGDRIVNRLMPLKTYVFKHGRNFRQPHGRNVWDPPEGSS